MGIGEKIPKLAANSPDVEKYHLKLVKAMAQLLPI